MRIIDPGHSYLLDNLDNEVATLQPLIFVKREGPGFPGNVGHHGGTNCQEVLRALIDRLTYLHGQIPDDRTIDAALLLRKAVHLLEQRAAERHGRNSPSETESVYGITCSKCGHVGCNGEHKKHIVSKPCHICGQTDCKKR